MYEYTLDGTQYRFTANAMADPESRTAYFKLAHQTFGLQFEKWYATGYADGHFVPYTLLDGGKAVSSVGVCVTDFQWKNQPLRCAQISTVMTDPAYRGKGLNKWLMETALHEWAPKSDMLYLYANDSVIEFYPKFGFMETSEYQSHKPVSPNHIPSRKLDMSLPENIDLLARKFKCSNPFSAFPMLDNLAQVVFHCTSFMKDHVYYIDQFDAIVVGEQDGEIFCCYDIYTASGCALDDVLGAVLAEDTKTASFGFTLRSTAGCTVTKLQEEDTHFFVLAGKENLLENNQLTFPFLSRA